VTTSSPWELAAESRSSERPYSAERGNDDYNKVYSNSTLCLRKKRWRRLTVDEVIAKSLTPPFL